MPVKLPFLQTSPLKYLLQMLLCVEESGIPQSSFTRVSFVCFGVSLSDTDIKDFITRNLLPCKRKTATGGVGA